MGTNPSSVKGRLALRLATRALNLNHGAADHHVEGADFGGLEFHRLARIELLANDDSFGASDQAFDERLTIDSLNHHVIARLYGSRGINMEYISGLESR